MQGSRQASVLLPVCKYVERSGDRKACCLPVHSRIHKRGFIAVACMANHQWVWCEACCDCNCGGAGCANPLHWMERDSFDTGKVSLRCLLFEYLFCIFENSCGKGLDDEKHGRGSDRPAGFRSLLLSRHFPKFSHCLAQHLVDALPFQDKRETTKATIYPLTCGRLVAMMILTLHSPFRLQRNHMQRHTGQTKSQAGSVSPASRPALNTKRMREDSSVASIPLLANSTTEELLVPAAKRFVSGNAFSVFAANSLLLQLTGPSAFALASPAPVPGNSVEARTFLRLDGANFIPGHTELTATPFFLIPATAAPPPPAPHATAAATAIAPRTVPSNSTGNSSPSSPPSAGFNNKSSAPSIPCLPAGEVRLLQSCKHTDRKLSRSSCPCEVRARPHKRGYLAVGCTSGHQYVWCASCCDCKIGNGVGCLSPLHWMERDSFDTGKRNHQQRHMQGAHSSSSSSTSQSSKQQQQSPEPQQQSPSVSDVESSSCKSEATSPRMSPTAVACSSTKQLQAPGGSPLEALAEAAIQMMEDDTATCAVTA